MRKPTGIKIEPYVRYMDGTNYVEEFIRKDKNGMLHRCVEMDTDYILNAIKFIVKRINEFVDSGIKFSVDDMFGVLTTYKDTKAYMVIRNNILFIKIFLYILKERCEELIAVYQTESGRLFTRDIDISYNYVDF